MGRLYITARDLPGGRSTRQQLRILRQICLGKSNKEISFALNISEATVKTHIAAVMSKTGAQRRTQIVLLANDIKLFKSD